MASATPRDKLIIVLLVR